MKKKIILWTPDPWSTSCLANGPSNPEYYIEDWLILEANVSSLHQLSNYILEKKNFFPWRNKLGLWVTTLLSMELFSIISSACYNQFPKQNGSGLRNEILKCMSIPTPRSYTPGCTINPYKNCSRINTYKFYWAE